MVPWRRSGCFGHHTGPLRNHRRPVLDSGARGLCSVDHPPGPVSKPQMELTQRSHAAMGRLRSERCNHAHSCSSGRRLPLNTPSGSGAGAANFTGFPTLPPSRLPGPFRTLLSCLISQHSPGRSRVSTAILPTTFSSLVLSRSGYLDIPELFQETSVRTLPAMANFSHLPSTACYSLPYLTYPLLCSRTL